MTWLADAFPRYRKFIVALAGLVGQAVLLLQDVIGSGLLHGKALAAVQVVLAGLTALGVKQASNDNSIPDAPEQPDETPDPDPEPAAVDEFAEQALSGGTATHTEGVTPHPLPYPPVTPKHAAGA